MTDSTLEQPAARPPVPPVAPPVPVRAIPASPAAVTPRQFSAFAPVLLLGLSLVAWLAFQAVQQAGEHQQLGAAEAALANQVQGATKVRNALEAIATATAKLAGDGNANARVVVEELRKRGVTINASSPAASQAQ